MGFLDKFKGKSKDTAVQPQPLQDIDKQLADLQATVYPSERREPTSWLKRKTSIKKTSPKTDRRKAVKKVRAPKPSKAKKSVPKKWLQKERDLLDDVLRDLNDELRSLRSARKKLESNMAKCSTQLGATQNQEISLRNKITDLMKKEAALTKKKTTAKDKLVDLDQKIEKVRTIQNELKNV